MKPIINWNEVKPSEGGTQRPQAGGYVCVITKAEDVPEKQYLLVEFDISEGDFAGYCSATYGKFGNLIAIASEHTRHLLTTASALTIESNALVFG